MVLAIAMSGVIMGILAAAFALFSGMSLLAVILAYCLTGSLAATLVVIAMALRPIDATSEPGRETQTV